MSPALVLGVLGLLAPFALAGLLLIGLRAPDPSVCTAHSSCLMRRKIALVPAVLTFEACGVADSVLADFMVWDRVTGTGKKILSPRFCPWCGAAYAWQGRSWEHGEPETESGEEWKGAPNA